MRSGRPARRPRTVADPDSVEDAYQEATRRLARQPQSRAMLAERLRVSGFSPAAVAGALERAEADGYINDREYAESIVRRRARSRGSAMIAQELRAKGIAEAAADPALAQVDADAELEHALRIGRSLLHGRRPADGQALLTYLAPRLARRGFASGQVYRVCRLLAAEWQASGSFDTLLEPN